MKKLFLITIIIVLTACHLTKELSGTYVSKSGDISVTFNPNGTGLSRNSDGLKIDDFTYSVEGNKINTPGRLYYFVYIDGSHISAGQAYGVLMKRN